VKFTPEKAGKKRKATSRKGMGTNDRKERRVEETERKKEKGAEK
tara:strand:- start:248 stop:379 length:132 start_codon:yes stop_codon:yes gene_type:complete